MKYKLIPEGNLFRLKATQSFEHAQKGDFGGLVSGSHNLSLTGDCWIDYTAKVLDYARVSEDALVNANALVQEYALVCGRARVGQSAVIKGSGFVGGSATVWGHALVTEFGSVKEQAMVGGYATVYGSGLVKRNAVVKGRAKVSKPVIYMYLHPFNVTITDDYMIIGCRSYSKAEWRCVSRKEAVSWDAGVGKFYDQYHKLLEQALED